MVGICGLAGSGKSTLAKLLTKRAGYYRIPFAAPLKSMLAAIGLSEEEINGNLKEEPCERLCGKTPREAMQLLGTEWGRELIGPNLWLNAWQSDAAMWPLVVADDVRFPNEADAVRRFGGIVIEIARPGAGSKVAPKHASEVPIAAPDYRLANTGDEAELWRKFCEIADGCGSD